jgi:hypothetical protein
VDFAELLPIYASDPKKAEKILLENPDLLKQLVSIGEAEKQLEMARSGVSLEGFKIAYKLFYKRDMPYVDEPVVEKFSKAFRTKTGVMYESWRGRGKSTFLAAWCAYLIGVRPVGSTYLVMINDGEAKAAGKLIAEIIETNPGWQKLFPHVVPDKESSWSVENGFDVVDIRETKGAKAGDPGYAEWRQKCLADHGREKSLLCAGIESGSIIGKHPTNGAWFDDLHDESNTRSQAEMKKIVDIVERNVIATWDSVSGSPAIGVFCTPWSDNPPDAYRVMLRTGIFEHIKMPVYRLDDDGEVFEPLGVRVKMTWPEVYPRERVEGIWYKNPAHFGQMYLCDLESLKGLRLKREWLHDFPMEKIDESWPVYFGIDFASTGDKVGSKDPDYFCCAIGRAIPGGGMVITGGFRGRLSISDALMKIKSLASFYPTLATIGVERFGAGKDFAELLRPMVYTSNLPVVTFPFEGTPVRSKGQKFEFDLAPMFTSGRMWVTDVKDDFLKAFEGEWISWDGMKSLTKHDDTLDAVYGMAYVGQGHLMPKALGNLPVKRKERMQSPLANIGQQRGYGGVR